MIAHKKSVFADKKLIIRAIKDSFMKLNPRVQAKNPVMLLVYISAALSRPDALGVGLCGYHTEH